MRRLTSGEWLWYVIFPPAYIVALIVGMLIAGWDSQVFINVTPLLIAAAFFPIGAGWWVMNMDKPVSARATNLSVSGLFASVVFESIKYALSFNGGVLYFALEGCSVVGFVPGMICAFYYFGVAGEADGPLRARGPKIIFAGWLSFIYVGIGSQSVTNIATGVFHADLLRQLWFWLGRIGLQAGVLLMAVGTGR